MKIVGLDLSLTSTGIALIEDRDAICVTRIQSRGRKDATLDQRHTRLHNLRLDICLAAHDGVRPDLIVIEGPSFGQARQGGQHDRAGLWWLVVDWLSQDETAGGWGIPVAEVSPASRAKYATGKGNAAKDAVLAAVVRRYPHVEVTGNDQADALILACMGARALGHPLEVSLPVAHLDAMTKVAWPPHVLETTP